MNRTARVLIVGAGAIADACHLPALRALSDQVQLVGAVDVNPDRLASFARKWSIQHTFTELVPALDHLRPDLVVVTTPPALHREQTIAALASGAWVWCEKPPCLSLAEYDQMSAAQRDGGPYAAIVFQQRFGSAAQHARRLIASGELGPPYVVHCQTSWYRDDAYFRVPWRGDWASEGAGPALGLGIHQIDLMLELLGEWTEVRAMAARLARDVRTDDVSTALVRFHSGALATVVTNVLSPRQTSHLRIDLRDATVELTHLYGHTNNDWTYTPAPHIDPASPRAVAWRSPPDQQPSSHETQLRDLLADWRAGRAPRASGADGRRSLELVTAIYKAALTATTVTPNDLQPGDAFYQNLHGNRPGWDDRARLTIESPRAQDFLDDP